MKILFINTSDISGGAAIAAYRLSKGLKKYYNTDNYFIVGNKRTKDLNIFCTRENRYKKIIEVLINKILNKLGLQYLYFPFSTKAILKKAEELKPDIISLHNTHGWCFKTSLIMDLSKIAPIVWTLHDMWSFTGHCAYSFGCKKWQEKCYDCPSLNLYPSININTTRFLWNYKKKIYKDSNVTAITPSNWLAGEARKSLLFDNKEILHINNGLDQDLFKPKDKEKCKYVLNIPKDAKVLMFSADSLDDPRKGGDYLIEVLRIINKKISNKIHIIIVGSGNTMELKKLDNLIVHSIGQFLSEIFMPICFSASDLFLFLSRADNLPNVLIESISCGTPCITFEVGGCGEIVKDNLSGCLIKPFDVEDFAEKTIKILNDHRKLEKLSKSAKNFAEKNFSLKMMSKNYFELFKRLLRA